MDGVAVTARRSPDFRMISNVVKPYLPALAGLFTHVSGCAKRAG